MEEQEPPRLTVAGEQQSPRLSLAGAATFTWRSLLVFLGVYVLVIALSRVLVVVLPLIVALLLTAILQPVVNGMAAHGIKRIIGTWVVLVGMLVAVVGIGMALAPPVVDQFQDLGPTLEESRDRIEEWLREGPLHLSRDEIDRYYQRAIDQIGGQSEAIASRVLEGAALVAEFVAGFLLVLVMLFFLLKDGPAIADFFLRQVPLRHHDLARGVGAKAWAVLSGYIRGTATIGVIEGASTALLFWIFGIPLVLPLAILFFIGAFFPLVGAVVAGAIAVLVALVAGGLTKALIALGIVLFVQQVESDLLAPLVLSRAVKLHPLAVLVVLTGGAVIGGLVGAFLAVPVTAVLTAVGTELKARGVLGPTAPPPAA